MGYDPLPIKFRKSPPFILSVTRTEFASGTGFVVFNLNKNSAGYVLTDNTIWSDSVLTSVSQGNTSGVYVKVQDIDFDVKFSLPQRIKGLLLANIAVGTQVSLGTADLDTYLIIQVRHFDGSTETDIANTQGTTRLKTGITVGTNTNWMDSIAVDITSVQNFKKDESLRITVEQWVKVPAGDTFDFHIGHDPKGRATDEFTTETFGTDNSISQIHVPFELDL